MRKKIFIQSITLTALMFFSCSIHEKNIDNSPSEDIRSAPLPDQTIEINSILAEGIIVQRNDSYYFVISKVIKRGRQAPIVLQGQQLLLSSDHKEYTIDGTITKATLSCQHPNQSNTIWSIEIKN
nr:hypothetical protein [uncultured Carboxylicivirga sp.]